MPCTRAAVCDADGHVLQQLAGQRHAVARRVDHQTIAAHQAHLLGLKAGAHTHTTRCLHAAGNSDPAGNAHCLRACMHASCMHGSARLLLSHVHCCAPRCLARSILTAQRAPKPSRSERADACCGQCCAALLAGCCVGVAVAVALAAADGAGHAVAGACSRGTRGTGSMQSPSSPGAPCCR